MEKSHKEQMNEQKLENKRLQSLICDLQDTIKSLMDLIKPNHHTPTYDTATFDADDFGQIISTSRKTPSPQMTVVRRKQSRFANRSTKTERDDVPLPPPATQPTAPIRQANQYQLLAESTAGDDDFFIRYSGC